MEIRSRSKHVGYVIVMASRKKVASVSHALVLSARRGSILCSRDNHPRGDGKAKSCKTLDISFLYEVIRLGDLVLCMKNLCAEESTRS